MKNLKRLTILLIALVFTFTTSGCEEAKEEQDNLVTEEANEIVEKETSSGDDPNYDIVFNQEEVLEIYIDIDESNWDLMIEDVEQNFAKSVGNKPGGANNREKTPPTNQQGQQAATNQTQTNNQIQIPTNTETDENPIWVESTITFDGETFEHVGIRFKGNSSLSTVASSDNNKFSFKLDFDEFEDEYEEIEDQRFYGFKQLNLNNNFGDQSLMHEKVAADLFREYGLVSAHTSFAAVYVNTGDGYQYFGVYTIVEEVDDTVLEDQFSDDSGNLYKPYNTGATFAQGTYSEEDMNLKNGEGYSDVEALYEIINSELRLSDNEKWLQELESIFDVDTFLKYLAVNNTIVNWDTYGVMNHNYYLYNNPDTGLLTWIPWDNNEALSEGKRGQLSLSLSEVGSDWPLISYIIDVDQYKETYETYLQEFNDTVFDSDKLTETIQDYYELIKAYAYKEESGYSFLNSDADFDRGVETLINHIESRSEAVASYLE